ncbi:MAG: hypothetical protein JO047_06585 [Alphaproteobacteria bacterium]|nr:hypothetical protein [Alphaproteobacteria bacterium]
MSGPPTKPGQPLRPGGPPTQLLSVVPQGTLVTACWHGGTPPERHPARPADGPADTISPANPAAATQFTIRIAGLSPRIGRIARARADERGAGGRQSAVPAK